MTFNFDLLTKNGTAIYDTSYAQLMYQTNSFASL